MADKKEGEGVALVIGGVLGVVLGILLGAVGVLAATKDTVETARKEYRELRESAIDRGFMEHNAKTGELEWIGESK